MKLSGKNITVPLARRIVGLPGHASSSFNRCVGGKLYGSHPGSRAAARSAFTAAAKACKQASNKLNPPTDKKRGPDFTPGLFVYSTNNYFLWYKIIFLEEAKYNGCDGSPDLFIFKQNACFPMRESTWVGLRPALAPHSPQPTSTVEQSLFI